MTRLLTAADVRARLAQTINTKYAGNEAAAARGLGVSTTDLNRATNGYDLRPVVLAAMGLTRAETMYELHPRTTP